MKYTAERLAEIHRRRRERVGLSVHAYGKTTGRDEKTIANWEAGNLKNVEAFLESLSRLGFTLQRRPEFSPDRLLSVED